MRKAACHSDCMDSSNPHRWRGKRLHHHGGGVCWLFVLLWMDSLRHELIVCTKWYKNNLKMRLTALLFDPRRRAPCHRPVGPNDKQHYHLSDYVVVNFPHLKLPSNIAPWDKLHKTVSRQNIHDMNKMFQLILTQTNSMYLSQ